MKEQLDIMKEQLERHLRKGLPAGTTFSVEEVVLFSGTTIYGKVSGGGQEWEKKAQEWLSLDLEKWSEDKLPTSATVSGSSNPTPDFEKMDRWIATTGQVVPTVLGLNTAVIADAFSEIEKHDLQVTTVYARADTCRHVFRLTETLRNGAKYGQERHPPRIHGFSLGCRGYR